MKEKENWMIENGFSKDGKIYCVGGGNTYLIKDQLKNVGFRYSQLLGWFSDKPKDVPAPYYIVYFTFDELYQWEPQFNKAFLYKDAKEKIKTKLSFVQNDTKSEFIGEINERIYDLLVNFKKRFGFIIWILSNIVWIVVNIIGPTNISQIIMYVIYMGLNIHGFIYWKKDKNKQT